MRYSDAVAVVLCAGKGERAKLGYNKVMFPLPDGCVAEISVRKFAKYMRVVVVASESDEAALRGILSDLSPAPIYVRGGETRTESVRSALAAIEGAKTVLIHDGARPFVDEKVIERVVDSARQHGSGVPVTALTSAVRLMDNGGSTAFGRENLMAVQTPEAFDFDSLCDAYARIEGDYADDSEVFERAGYSVATVPGDEGNIKLTGEGDFVGLNSRYRSGIGFDVHPLVPNRRLVLCGREFDFPLGLDGHSDADVAAHAVMDALLSAAALPDIGVMFPDTDPSYRGADSMELLKKVCEKIEGYIVENVAVCVIAQQPKISPHVYEMRQHLAAALGIDCERVVLGATTTEFLGIVGEGKGIAASAIALLRKK